MAILILFFCSGATALVYEVLWSKYLALLFGSTIQAQTVVLAVFMGGLALGNKIFGRGADRALHPLRIYGAIETTIGLYAVLFSWMYRGTDSVFAVVGAHLLDRPFMFLLFKGLLSVLLLLGPTILMGGTLPILAAWLQKQTPDAGRRSARFYAVNSFGAVVGAGLTGFCLVEWLGLRGTMDYCALLNLVIGFVAILLDSKHLGGVKMDATDASANAIGGEKSGRDFFKLACGLVALTGAVSMGLELLASRCLCLIFGASLQVFAVVLIAFILGISVGSLVISSPAVKNLRAEGLALGLVLGSALVIGLLVFNIENFVALFLKAQSGLSRNLMGYRYYQTLDAALSICIIGIPAAALGGVLPLCIRSVSIYTDLLGDRVGKLLTWNTLGAVAGSLLTGFVLMPGIGLRGSFAALAAILLIGASVAAIALRRSWVVAIGALIGIFIAVAAFSGDENWRYVFSAGVFRLDDPNQSAAYPNYSMTLLRNRREHVQLDFYEDAADATVTVENVKGDPELSLRIDGKVDASATGDASTQLLLAYLPLMAKPESKEVFCFGMGSGITAGATLNYPIDHLTVAENCEPVLRAARLFDPWNNGVLTNNRAQIYHDDARTVLKLSQQKYDVIISEPSNPWMMGVASVFTHEFYQLASSRLKAGGIMAQWFHTYEMDDETVDVVLRTFATVFPQMEIWDVAGGDIVLLGSDRPWKSDTGVYASALEDGGPRRGLVSIGLATPEAVLARRMASQRTAFAIPGPGLLQTDDAPILEYQAPREFYIHRHNRGVFRLQRFDERTWQMELADAKSKDDLAKLDPPTLETIFSYAHGSANEDMFLYLKNLYAKYCGQGTVRPLLADNRAMPFSLQGTNRAFGIYTPPSATTNQITRQLVMAEYTLRSDSGNHSSIDGFEGALMQFNLPRLDWSPAYYADLGVKAALRMSDPKSARAILLRGLQLEPESDQLRYLSRILLREKILKPEDLAQAALE